jgi:hypothetical protein
MGVEADAWEADLADVSRIPLLYGHAQRLGPVEVLVNNAAYWEADTFVPAGAELDNKWSCGRIGPEGSRPTASTACLP